MMGNGFGFGIPGFGMILVRVLIIVAVVVLLRAAASGGSRGGGKTARQLLDERFARGEIDRQEYEDRRRLLEQ